MSFGKFLRTPFFTEHLRRLLLLYGLSRIVNESLIVVVDRPFTNFLSKEFQILLMDRFFIRYIKKGIERADIIIVK